MYQMTWSKNGRNMFHGRPPTFSITCLFKLWPSFQRKRGGGLAVEAAAPFGFPISRKMVTTLKKLYKNGRTPPVDHFSSICWACHLVDISPTTIFRPCFCFIWNPQKPAKHIFSLYIYIYIHCLFLCWRESRTSRAWNSSRISALVCRSIAGWSFVVPCWRLPYTTKNAR